MTLKELVEFEKEWLDEAGYTKENVIIALCSIKALNQQLRDCKTCKHSDNGNCAGTEECHECMWESKYEQQSCEDYIKREDALMAIEFAWFENDDWDFRLNIERRIKKLPAVKLVRPKGEWVLIHPLQENDDGAYICSNCEHGDWDCDINYKYCPFCGADMRGD